jgi:hypothetical protein
MMPRAETSFFGGLARGFGFSAVDEGEASLLPVELAEVPMTAVRSFLVSAPAGTVRGGHGHRSGCQLLVRISGEIKLELALGDETAQLVLDHELNAAIIHAPVWSRQTYRDESPRLLVFCNTPYDPDSYIYEHPGES